MLPWQQYNSTGSLADRNKVVTEYWPLVGKIARQVYRRIKGTVSVDELQSFGAVGLIEAVERFNPEIQTSFEGYASIRIRGSIIDELRAMDWIPRSIRVKEQQWLKIVDKLTMDLNRLPTDNEIQEALKMGADEYRRFMVDVATPSIQSIDSPVSRSDNTSLTLHDILPDVPSEESQDYTERVLELINSLPLRERIVLRLLYVENLTFPEIAELMAFGESRANQIHSSAIQALQMERN